MVPASMATSDQEISHDLRMSDASNRAFLLKTENNIYLKVNECSIFLGVRLSCRRELLTRLRQQLPATTVQPRPQQE